MFAPSKRFKAMPYDTVVKVIEPFANLSRQEGAPFQNLAVYVGDCALNLDDFPQIAKYLKENKVEGWQSVAADGFRRRSLEDWTSYLQALRQAGTEILEFSLYGKQAIHDWFAGFPGSYASLHRVAKLWQAIGGQVLWSIFVHKRNVKDISDLQNILEEQYGTRGEVAVWEYVGWGAHSDHLRIDQEDLKALDAASQKALAHLKTEKEWVEVLAQKDEPPFEAEPRVIHVSVDRSGEARIPYTTVTQGLDGARAGNIFIERPERILERWESFYKKWANSCPTIADLCHKYGDEDNRRLYSQRSVIRKWCAKWEVQQ